MLHYAAKDNRPHLHGLLCSWCFHAHPCSQDQILQSLGKLYRLSCRLVEPFIIRSLRISLSTRGASIHHRKQWDCSDFIFGFRVCITGARRFRGFTRLPSSSALIGAVAQETFCFNSALQGSASSLDVRSLRSVCWLCWNFHCISWALARHHEKNSGVVEVASLCF